MILIINRFINPNIKYTLVRGLVFYIIITSILINTLQTTINSPTFESFNTEQVGYIKQLLYYIFLYIPCLVVDLLKPLQLDFYHTNTTTIILFIGLIGYISWTMMYPLIAQAGDTYLINEPQKLNQEIINISVNNPIESFVSINEDELNSISIEKTIDLINDFKVGDPVKTSRTTVRQVAKLTTMSDENKLKSENSNYAYAVSFWLYLDGQTTLNTSQSLIMTFGMRPSLYYDPLNKVLVVEISTDQPRVYTTPLYQKWNHIVFNYVNGVFDLFINNELVSTEMDAVNIIGDDDHIIVGSIRNSDFGSISKFIYFNHALSISKIDQLNKIK
tara:strand:- start:121 stop:1113 length:993 start_codon:yes stop_codon:yes gene_type:complete